MRHYLKRWRLPFVALVAAFALSFTFGAQAFAAEPGEGNQFQPELSSNAPIQSQDTMSEATSPISGTIVQIERGYFDNHVWAEVNHGSAFAIGTADGQDNTTQTYVAPRVIYSNGWFYAFQTGIDGNIYWSRAADSPTGSNVPAAAAPNRWSAWQPIGGNTTNQSVSLASTPSGLLMVYRGSGNDTRLFSVWLSVGAVFWDAPLAISNFTSNSAPVVAFNAPDNLFFMTWRGLSDDRIYLASLQLGTNNWSSASQLPSITTNSSPVIASTPDGHMLVAARDYNNNVWFQTIDRFGSFGGWSSESTGYQTTVSPFLSVVSGVIYILLTGLYQGTVYWKPAYNPN